MLYNYIMPCSAYRLIKMDWFGLHHSTGEQPTTNIFYANLALVGNILREIQIFVCCLCNI